MASFISRDGSYHEGDGQIGDVVVPQRPDATYVFSAGSWIQDPTKKAEADELVRLQTELAAAKLIPEVPLLINATPAQIRTWYANNVTNLTQARDALILLTQIVGIIGRQAFK